MKKSLILASIIVGIIVTSLVVVIVTYENTGEENTGEENNTTIKENQEKENIIEINPLVIEHEFTVNMKGNTKHGDILTISGIVPNVNSSITGMIYHGGEDNPTIVTVFQLTSDDVGFYTHDVVINDDYLWKQEKQYIISIQNTGIYKELQFHRNW